MKKSDIQQMPQFFDKYIYLANDEELIISLEKTSIVDPTFIMALENIGDRIYAANKWTVKDIFQHLIDNERIQDYRALRFARADTNLLPGYDEQPYALNAKANTRSLNSLIEEFTLVRSSSIALFKSFDDEMLLREGICYNIKISVLALGFVIVGHPIHHFNIIRERYLPLL